jgi:hypothetical protein
MGHAVCFFRYTAIYVSQKLLLLLYILVLIPLILLCVRMLLMQVYQSLILTLMLLLIRMLPIQAYQSLVLA